MPAAAIAVPSPKGRWKRLPSARANSSPSTPLASSSSPASTNENGPKVLTIRRTAADPARRCSKLSSRAARKTREANSAIVERPAATEAGVGLVPEGDRVLALLPAEVDLLAVAERREVEQPAVEVAQDHLQLAQLDHRVAQLEEALGNRAPGCAPAIGRPRFGERIARVAVAELVAGHTHALDDLDRSREQLGGLLECVVAGVDHAAARAPSRMRRSSSLASASETALSWPWKASCQCSAGHFAMCSSCPTSSTAGTNSSSSSTTSGSVSKRQGWGSTFPGFPGQIFSRSSYISPVTRTIPPNAWTPVT